MTPADLANLKRLEAEATPGEWTATLTEVDAPAWVEANVTLDEDGDQMEGDLVASVYTGENGKVALSANKHYRNAALIVALRNSARELIGAAEERDRLRAREAEWVRAASSADPMHRSSCALSAHDDADCNCGVDALRELIRTARKAE